MLPEQNTPGPARGRRALTVALLTGAALSLLGALAVTPAAAATCTGGSCNGQSAAATGCDQDARIVAGALLQQPYELAGAIIGVKPTDPAYGAVHVWESPSCQTYWAEAAVSQPTGHGDDQLITDLTVYNRGAHVPAYTVEARTDGNTPGATAVTTMWSYAGAPAGAYQVEGFGWFSSDFAANDPWYDETIKGTAIAP